MTKKKIALWESLHTAPTKERNKGIGELILLVAFFLFCVKYIVDISEILVKYVLIDNVLVALMIFLPVCKVIFFQRYSLPRALLTAVIALTVGISCLIGGNYLFLNGFFFALAMQDVDIDKVAKLSFRFKSACILFHVLCYAYIYSVDPNSVRFVYRAGYGPPRHTFFMGHANLFTSYLVWVSLDYLYIKYNKLNIFHVTAVWLINLVFFIFTGTNTGLMVLLIVTTVIGIDKIGKKIFNKIINLLAKYSYLFFSLLFAFLTVIYTQLSGTARHIWEVFDKFMTGRMWPGAFTYEKYGFTLFGRKLKPAGVFYWQGGWRDAFLPFDNYYLGNLYNYGIIHLVVIALAMILLCGKMEGRDKIMVIAFSFYGIMQKDIVIVAVCFVLFIIGKYLYPAREYISRKKKGEINGCR